MIRFDNRRDIEIPGDKEQTLKFCVDHFITVANETIVKKGRFFAALSGGNTPKAIYQALAQPENAYKVDWKHVYLFWSDERCVSSSHADSNYKMAMDNGLSLLAIPENQIFRMKGEINPTESAEEYDSLIRKNVPDCSFDYMMLGMGDDGHTASLFPYTEALHVEDRQAVANFLPQKQVWRLTLTYECINNSKNIVIYVLGAGKAPIVEKVFTSAYLPDELPVQKVGTTTHKALWIMDQSAASGLKIA